MLCIPVILLISAGTLCKANLPSNYVALSAQQKQQLQWNHIVKTKYDFSALPTDFPIAGSNVSLLTDSNYVIKSFTTYEDEMPGSHRRTVLEPFADVCKINFRTFKNSTSQFTGIFHTGGVGIIRLALDGTRNVHQYFTVPRESYYEKAKNNFSPSAAIKTYIDGTWSQNMVLVGETYIGQGPDKNFFRDPVSNVIKDLPPGMTGFNVYKPLRNSFRGVLSLLPGDALARPESTKTIGLYENAAVNADGSNVNKIIAPYEAILVPNPALTINSTVWGRDFRQNIHAVVEVGKVIYTMYGRRTNESVAELVGEIVADSECLASQYGDRTLFFRHAIQQWRP